MTSYTRHISRHASTSPTAMYERYQNTYQLFNSFFKEFARWYATNYNPAEAYEEGLI